MGGRRGILFRNWLICCSVLCCFTLTLGGASTVLAQDDEFILEEIVVTGSRIVRNNNESASPIVTVDEKMFDHSSTMAIETQLNKLPQFTPTIDLPTTGVDIQPTARNIPGEATVSLRGLGANRSMVLINGRRGTPAGGGMYVDINTLPSAAIEYTEAISGGASATYGADAMAGVVNFMMKDQFVGAEFDIQMGMNQEGDEFEYQVSSIIGADIADGRGNINISFAYNKREESWQRDRSWYKELWRDPKEGGTQYFSKYSGFVVGGDPAAEEVELYFPGSGYFGAPANTPDVGVVNSVMGLTDNPFTSIPDGMIMWADDFGQAFTGFGFFNKGPEGVAGSDTVADGLLNKKLSDGTLATNNLTNYLILPMERFNMFSQGNYEINDYIGVYMQGYFSKNKTETVQEPSPITGGWSFYVDPTINRNVIPAELMTILDSRPDPDVVFQINAMLPDNRDFTNENYTYNLVVGLEGMIPKIDWTWDLSINRGESESTSTGRGYGSLQRIKAIMTSGPNFGQGFEQQGNQGAPGAGFGASTGTCASGFNVFDWDSITADCWNAVGADLKSRQVMEQTIYELNFQGPVVELPAGEMRAAVGYSSRENDYFYNNDTIVTEGRSFLEQALGLYPADNTYGNIQADEFYGEVLIPVLSDLPFIKQLDLEIGGRSSDYNTTGVSTTYKALADWRILDSLRVRGGYNKAERSPNMAELFLAPEQIFSFGAANGDVCAYGNLNPWGANPDVNADWQQVLNLCGEIMEASGSAGADTAYYGLDYREISVTNPPTEDTALGTGAAGAFPHSIGNPDLSPETADTWTIGIVVDSPFVDIPALADLRLSLDYYSIEVSEAIGLQSADIVMQQCMDPRFNPDYDINSPFCEGFTRTQEGNPGNITTKFFNNGEFKTSGIDLAVDWSMDLGPGRVGVNSKVSYLIEKSTTEMVGVNPLVDYAGTLGPGENGLDGSSYEWQAFTTVSYSLDELYLAIGWNYYDSIEQPAYATVGTTLVGGPVYNLFDLNGSYILTDNMSIRFGVNNLFNREPPVLGRDTNFETDVNTFAGYRAGVYDTQGRRFYLGAKVTF